MAEETMNDFMDEIDKSLAKGKDGDGFIWDKLHALLDSGEYVDVEVTEAVKGGVVAFLEEKRGFIPASKLSLSYVDEEKLQPSIILMMRPPTAQSSSFFRSCSSRVIRSD